jgi:hypothetical protein
MLVCKGAHRVEDAFVDDAANEYIPRDKVSGGYWFECYSRPEVVATSCKTIEK